VKKLQNWDSDIISFWARARHVAAERHGRSRCLAVTSDTGRAAGSFPEL